MLISKTFLFPNDWASIVCPIQHADSATCPIDHFCEANKIKTTAVTSGTLRTVQVINLSKLQYDNIRLLCKYCPVHKLVRQRAKISYTLISR